MEKPKVFKSRWGGKTVEYTKMKGKSNVIKAHRAQAQRQKKRQSSIRTAFRTRVLNERMK